jgi:hypothetical protein
MDRGVLNNSEAQTDTTTVVELKLLHKGNLENPGSKWLMRVAMLIVQHCNAHKELCAIFHIRKTL